MIRHLVNIAWFIRSARVSIALLNLELQLTFVLAKVSTYDLIALPLTFKRQKRKTLTAYVHAENKKKHILNFDLI